MPYDPDAIEPGNQEISVYAELSARIRSDPEYAWGWHCTVACAALDEGIDHESANKIAARAMYNMFQADTSAGPSGPMRRPDRRKLAGGSNPPRSLWEHLKEP